MSIRELHIQVAPSAHGDQYDRGFFEGSVDQVYENRALIYEKIGRQGQLAIYVLGRDQWQVALGRSGSWSTIQPTFPEAVAAAERKEFN